MNVRPRGGHDLGPIVDQFGRLAFEPGRQNPAKKKSKGSTPESARPF
jgi:hypothetical protein